MQTNIIYCGECAEMMRCHIPDNSIGLTVTSPPYDDLREYGGYMFEFEPIARELYRITKPGGIMVWVISDGVYDGSEGLTSAKQKIYFVEQCNFRLWQTIIWNKPGTHPNAQGRYPKMHEYCFVFSKGMAATFNPILKKNKYAGAFNNNIKRQRNGKVETYGNHIVGEYGTRTTVWDCPVGWMHSAKDKEAYNHPAIFPEALARDHIISWSNPGDIVLDPMCGSGTTLKMAVEQGRQYIGIDISEEYCELSRQRVASARVPLPGLEPPKIAEQAEQLTLDGQVRD